MPTPQDELKAAAMNAQVAAAKWWDSSRIIAISALVVGLLVGAFIGHKL